MFRSLVLKIIIKQIDAGWKENGFIILLKRMETSEWLKTWGNVIEL